MPPKPWGEGLPPPDQHNPIPGWFKSLWIIFCITWASIWTSLSVAHPLTLPITIPMILISFIAILAIAPPNPQTRPHKPDN
jgi:hypothetical protein